MEGRFTALLGLHLDIKFIHGYLVRNCNGLIRLSQAKNAADSRASLQVPGKASNNNEYISSKKYILNQVIHLCIRRIAAEIAMAIKYAPWAPLNLSCHLALFITFSYKQSENLEQQGSAYFQNICHTRQAWKY